MEQNNRVMSKRTANQLNKCRDIVKEIKDFGVNELMTLQIINLLAIELENREALIEICGIVKRYLPADRSKKQILILIRRNHT